MNDPLFEFGSTFVIHPGFKQVFLAACTRLECCKPRSGALVLVPTGAGKSSSTRGPSSSFVPLERLSTRRAFVRRAAEALSKVRVAQVEGRPR